jgi:peptidoglycan/LPS O-acetylase OafA/YrhL
VNSRDLARDIRWGIREGLSITAIAFVPALLVVSVGGQASIMRFAQIFAAYLLFGAGGGALVGFARPSLSKNVGVAITGAIIGAIGFVALVCIPTADHPFPGMRVAAIAAVLGALVGASLALWTSARARKRDHAA